MFQEGKEKGCEPFYAGKQTLLAPCFQATIYKSHAKFKIEPLIH
jgi:hypothetical protein